MKSIIYLFIACLSIIGCRNINNNGIDKQQQDTDSTAYTDDSVYVDSDAVHVCVSEDGLVKFTSWNTGQGGTCPDYAVICEYKTSKGEIAQVKLHEKDEMAAWVNDIHVIKKGNGKHFYLIKRSHRASSQDGYCWMEAFVIDSDTMKFVCPIDGESSTEKETRFDVNYGIGDWYDITSGYGYDWMMEYVPQTKCLYISESESNIFLPRMTDRYEVFQFNGKKFVSLGSSQPNRRLHKSLSDYEHLESYFKTKAHTVRIDSVRGGYRYVSWNNPSDMSRIPDLVIFNGKKNDETGLFTFSNNGYTYQCKIEEIIRDNEDSEILNEYLVISKNGKIIQREKVINE